MRIAGEKVDHLAMFAGAGLLLLVLWSESFLPIAYDDKGLLGIATIFVAIPLLLVAALTLGEKE